jgi:N,N'-diacetyllegionaminate synthase
MEIIAETAWHHEGDLLFMKNLVNEICEKTETDFVKLHLTLDLNEYMSKDHQSYTILKKWLFTENQWAEIIQIVRSHNKKLLLLLNDTKAIEFASEFSPEAVELHSVCLNVPRLQNAVIENIDKKAKIFIGVGGSLLDEINHAINKFLNHNLVLMFGFQNYPTRYENINLMKINKIQSMFSDLDFGYADHTSWDEKHNELITLLVAANKMQYIEKHVTTHFGEERCDFAAAVSIKMFNAIHDKMKLLIAASGDGSLLLNEGEIEYSALGPMKMVPYALKDLSKGDKVSINDFDFIRTSQISDITQVGFTKIEGRVLKDSIKKDQVIVQSNFIAEY